MAIAEDAEDTDEEGVEADDESPTRTETDSSDRVSAGEQTDEPRTTDAEATADGRYTRKKCVLITGCSSGIGRACAEAFLEEEWTVVATSRDTDDIAGLADAGCITRELDVTRPEQVAQTVERTVELGGAIDCLVNNGGYAQMGPLEDVSTSDLHRQFDVNVYGPHRLTRAALPHMRAQGKGRIINVSSVLGRISVPGSGAYSGSKFALEAMSDALRGEVEEFGIDVVLIEPGTVETQFVDRVESELPRDGTRTPDYEKLYEIYDDAETIGGSGPLAIAPEDVAAAILHAGTCPDPPARYPVGPVAQYGLYARFLPDSVRDMLYGLVRKFV